MMQDLLQAFAKSHLWKDKDLFWNKERTVRVELVNAPRLALEPQSQAAAAVSERKDVSIHLDTVLKMAASIAVVANASLLTLGYMRYLALMEFFGIARSEVSFSVADLLAYGYGDVLNNIFASRLTQGFFGVVAGAIGIFMTALFWTGKPTWRRDVSTFAIATILATIPAAPLLISYYPAKKMAIELAAEHLEVDKEKLQKVRKRFEFDTPEGTLSGDVLLTTPDYTYLLAEKVVYKIKAENNTVVRKTYLEAELKEEKTLSEPSTSSPP